MGGTTTNRSLVRLELFVAFDSGVSDLGRGGQEVVLCALILIDDGLLLGVVEHEKLLLFSGRDVHIGGSPALNLLLEDREKRVVVVLHDALSETNEG